MVTLVHHIFPNTIVAQLSRHTTIVVLEPLSIDSTRLVTWRLANRTSHQHQNGGAGSSQQAAADRERDTGFVDQGAAEDLAVACAVQRSLASGANEALTFGRFEGAISHFHRRLHQLVDPAHPAVGAG